LPLRARSEARETFWMSLGIMPRSFRPPEALKSNTPLSRLPPPAIAGRRAEVTTSVEARRLGALSAEQGELALDGEVSGW
jgi:hypothetical protein